MHDGNVGCNAALAAQNTFSLPVTQQAQDFLLTKGCRVGILASKWQNGLQMFGKIITHQNLTDK